MMKRLLSPITFAQLLFPLILTGVNAPIHAWAQDTRAAPQGDAAGDGGKAAVAKTAPAKSSTEIAPDDAYTSDASDTPTEEVPSGSRKKKPKNFRKSRLTHETSEGVADRRRILLTTGEDRAVDLDFDVEAGANGISTGNPQVVLTTLVRIGDQRRQIIFKPLKAGETTATVRDPDGSIRLIFDVVVTGNNLLRRAGEMRELLRDVEGIDIRVVGQKVVIDGEVLVPSDYARLFSVVTDASYSGVVMNLATLSPFAMQLLAKKIQEDINTFATQVKTRVVNGMIFLEGTVDNVDQAKRAAEVARLYLPEVRPGNPLMKDQSAQILGNRPLVQNFLVINPPPPKKQEKLVRVTVHFVELDKDYNKVFAFKWAPGFTADPSIAFGGTAAGGAGAAGTSFTGTISSLFPKLQSAQSAGYARVLKTGTVIVRSGKPAHLEETTDFASTALNNLGQPVAQPATKVGLSVDLTPQILGQSEDIQLDLKLTQSNVTGRAPASGPPTTSNHTVTTAIYVKSNESAAVGGVVSADVGTDFNKDDPRPGSFTGTTDELFNLMRSKNYRKKKSQFVIFVTPQIVENASEGTEDLKKNFRVKVK
ncbi:MAG: hypothetical protein H7222_06430 [Methylotenera sp.]|nr:hypothetical protein [Oligoflexia bacterium]